MSARVRSISVLIPTRNGAEFLERLLDALAAQRLDLPWDLTVVDSGSTDGTLELLEQRRPDFPVPLSVREIHPLEFDHGDTRNLLAAESAGELLVFLTQDAIPTGDDWLATLAGNFDDPAVGAAYCRNLPRPDADLLAQIFSAGDPGYALERREVRLPPDDEYIALDPHARRLLYNFNDVASAVRRSLWVRHPFPRTVFGEDLLMSRALLEAGHTIVYDAEATVEHSHDWSPAQLRERALVDGRFNVEWLGRTCVATASDASTLVARQLEVDREALIAAGLDGAELEARMSEARALREATFEGLLEGGRSPERRPRTQVLEREQLHVLYVVHGFPPDTWAGTEVYTLELAREVQRLGHRVTILTRAPLGEGQADYDVTVDEFAGLPVWRMAHEIEGQTIRQSYDRPEGEAVFERALDELRPDVVHFQHLLHFSARLPELAGKRGIPTVITCNDYWALCARVQLIRPDGVRCEENQGMGCLVCVKEKDYSTVPTARSWLPVVAPAAHALTAAAGAPPVPSVKVERKLQRWRIKLGRWGRGYLDLAGRQAAVEGGYAAADLLIGPSRFLRQKLLDTGRFDAHRFLYSDYGMRLPADATAGQRERAPGPLRLGYIGSLVWFKGVDVLVRAVARLDPGQVQLAIHGDFKPADDAHHAELRDLAPEHVTFHGRFDNDRLAEVYADIDVLVVPSVWFENSPITIHEAFLYGTPVVTSDIGGMAELVGDGEHGLHFKTGDDRDLARVLQRLIDEAGLVAQLGRDLPRVKSIEENAREMEFRYRALACIQR